jgi:hypothetical protein
VKKEVVEEEKIVIKKKMKKRYLKKFCEFFIFVYSFSDPFVFTF